MSVPFHILDGAAKKLYESRYPGHWEGLDADLKAEVREGVKATLPMLRRYFTAQVEGETEKLEQQVENLRKALEPFAVFARGSEGTAAVESHPGWPGDGQWTDFGVGLSKDRIVDWFGPTDFYHARAAFNLTQQVEEELRYTAEALRDAVAVGEEEAEKRLAGGEPRYTLEQLRGGAAAVADACGITERLILEILDHFTQQPVGVGAVKPSRGDSNPARGLPPESMNAAPGGADCPPAASADSDGNHQPLGVKSEHGDGVTTRVSPAGHAEGDAQKQHTGVKPGAVGESPALRDSSAAGGSGQGAGSALEELLGWVEEMHLRRQRASEDESARREFRAADRGAAVALEDVGVRVRQLLTQQPSDGQEGGVEEDEDTAIRRELLLALQPICWASTRDLATMVGVPPIHGDITPVRNALYALRDEGRVELQRRSGSLGYRWRLLTQPSSDNKSGEG